MTEQPIPSLRDDPHTWYLPRGDVVDMTGVEYEDSQVEELCHALFNMGNKITVVCTRPELHEGSHVAGDCDRVIVLWDPPSYRIEEEPV